jgi:hypothetical protein
MTNLSRLHAVVRFAVPAAAFAVLCGGGVVGHSVTKDLGDTVLTSVDGSTAVPNRLNVADKEGSGAELVRTA